MSGVRKDPVALSARRFGSAISHRSDLPKIRGRMEISSRSGRSHSTPSQISGTEMNSLVRWLIGWPERVAQHLQWVAPLFARVVVGWVFMWSGWGKLQNLPAIIDNFAGWKIPAP